MQRDRKWTKEQDCEDSLHQNRVDQAYMGQTWDRTEHHANVRADHEMHNEFVLSCRTGSGVRQVSNYALLFWAPLLFHLLPPRDPLPFPFGLARVSPLNVMCPVMVLLKKTTSKLHVSNLLMRLSHRDEGFGHLPINLCNESHRRVFHLIDGQARMSSMSVVSDSSSPTAQSYSLGMLLSVLSVETA